jgi:hypothetical protein
MCISLATTHCSTIGQSSCRHQLFYQLQQLVLVPAAAAVAAAAAAVQCKGFSRKDAQSGLGSVLYVPVQDNQHGLLQVSCCAECTNVPDKHCNDGYIDVDE